MLTAAIIGFGGIAKGAHLNSHLNLEKEGKIRLAAVCDIRPEAFETKVSLNIGEEKSLLPDSVRRYTDYRQMIEEIRPDLVDICVPTYLHKEISITAMRMGCHVLCEKPMSLSEQECLEMVRTAQECGRKLMIAQCIRFSEPYRYLREIARSQVYGAPKSGIFRRISAPPRWSSWFLEYEKSGGCITDMHIHDLDIIRDIFGEPKAVSCAAQKVFCKDDTAYSTLHYEDFFICAVGDWSQSGSRFIADYRVSFEKAIVELSDGKVTVYERDGKSFSPDLPQTNMYQNEIEYLADCISTGSQNTVNPPESAARSVKLAAALSESAENGGILLPFSD